MEVPRLRELRVKAFLSQLELAQKSGISQITLNRIEMGRHKPRFSTIRKLAEALGIPPEELVKST